MVRPGTPTRIMIVEDDEVDIIHIQREFQRIGTSFRFYFAENGVDALNKIYGTEGEDAIDPPPQIFIVDIQMPKMGGNAFIKALRRDPQFNHVPIFVVTNSYNEKDQLAVKDLGVIHLIKPLSRDVVLSLMRKHLSLQV